MKYFLSSILSLAISLSTFAQNNPGVDYMTLGETELAKGYFMKAMRQSPTESYYYLGQMAYEAGKTSEAKENFEKGLAGNPESALNAVGLAKLDLKNNQKEAQKELNNILKKNKKDVTVLIEIARAFHENGMAEDGAKAIAEAKKANKNSPYIYIFEGSLLQKAGKIGEAAAQYDQAINFDPECALAYVKGAQVYRDINPTMAKDMLKKAGQKQPSYNIIYKYLADMSYNKGFYPDAIEAFKKYMSAGEYTVNDIRDLAAAQYFTDDYTSAVQNLQEGLNKEPQNFVLNRLMMYSRNATGEYSKGLDVAKTFFAIPRDTSKYIVQDHMTYANILKETGDQDQAIAEYEKAIVLDSSKVDIYKEISETCANDRMFEAAGDFMKKYVEKVGDAAESNDFFQIGNYYYRAGDAARKDSALAATAPALLDKADVEFAIVAERRADVPLGYLMRARVNASKDPETELGLAKPHYEKVVEICLAEIAKDPAADRKAELVEAYTYLSYYYYLQYAGKNVKSAKEKGLENVDKLLELDPTNATGTQLKPAF